MTSCSGLGERKHHEAETALIVGAERKVAWVTDNLETQVQIPVGPNKDLIERGSGWCLVKL